MVAPPGRPGRAPGTAAAAAAPDDELLAPALSALDDEAAQAEAGDPADQEAETRAWSVSAAEHGQRLDKVLVLHAGEFSRNHLQSLIERGHVQVDGAAAASASRKLKLGQAVQVTLVPTAQSRSFRAEAMDLRPVFEDEHLLVIDKPAGLVVHPAAGHWSGTLLNGLLAHHPGAFDLPRAGIVHRLDKDTSGLMVVAKTLPAMTALTRAIAAREVHRAYRALVHGEMKLLPFTVEAPVGRDPQTRVRMAVVGSGKPARTDVQPLAARQGVCAVRCTLHTGRTHQIRVHMAHKGHPLVADTLYGGRPLLGLARQALHAAELRFEHPIGGGELAFEAPLPADLAAAWSQICDDASSS
ncbi:RluA family pseudouridine synthase [Aquincola tertiaricarbonis]|uniref:Pseudouridine synthase n=1 Tax=Aquincola tertiaricarbonis TaxID=391953 RepID=A0ABY4S5V0_AQUTE|nr:RluA family pseudouridine synthase [Aquincola tertiaricarbonis]URI08707.1 RluA family pseudouridine synthase [Aquincola tertiaricarbonis]